jgi:hypothetical protein
MVALTASAVAPARLQRAPDKRSQPRSISLSRPLTHARRVPRPLACHRAQLWIRPEPDGRSPFNAGHRVVRYRRRTTLVVARVTFCEKRARSCRRFSERRSPDPGRPPRRAHFAIG